MNVPTDESREVSDMTFIGRAEQLSVLDRTFETVRATGAGQLVSMQGRRQVGKSRLLEHFVTSRQMPHAFVTAVKHASVPLQMERVRREITSSTLPITDADLLFGTPASGWSEVLDRLVVACRTTPSVVILDEFPWAVDTAPELEGLLQARWDRELERLPVLFVIVGSDLAMMERLTEHDRPLFGRARRMIVPPMNPRECAPPDRGLPRQGAAPVRRLPRGEERAVNAFDTYLVTGGMPRLVVAAAAAPSLLDFVHQQLGSDTSELVVQAQLALAAEFPADVQARSVLAVIGADEVGATTFSTASAGLPLPSGAARTAVTRALNVLRESKRLIAVETPAASPTSARLKRYRIADPSLRFWFRFVEPELARIARGRSDVAQASFAREWRTFRGRAIEPVVHEAVLRLAPDLAVLGDVDRVGGWWNRQNNPEIDLVATSRGALVAAGSVKWRTDTRFGSADAASLRRSASVLNGSESAAMIAICPAGGEDGVSVDAVLTAADLLGAWPGRDD